ILNPFSSLSRSLALIFFDEAQTITANAALARSRGGNRSSAMAPTTLCIVAFTVEIIPDSLLSCGRPASQIDRLQVRTKKRVSVAAGSRLSVVILPPALSMPAQPLRLSCLHHTPCDRVAAAIPQNAGCLRLRGSPGRFLQSDRGTWPCRTSTQR